MATAQLVPRPRATAGGDGRATQVTLCHDPPCPWCSHSHHFLPCDDCSCPAQKHYPGEI